MDRNANMRRNGSMPRRPMNQQNSRSYSQQNTGSSCGCNTSSRQDNMQNRSSSPSRQGNSCGCNNRSDRRDSSCDRNDRDRRDGSCDRNDRDHRNDSCDCNDRDRRDNSCDRNDRDRRDSSCDCSDRNRRDSSCDRTAPARTESLDTVSSCGNNEDRTCGIPKTIVTTSESPAGMGYVPWQTWTQTYDLCKALMVGTLFPELDYPFEVRRCRS